MKTTYVLQDLTRAWQWPIGKGLPEAMADFSKGAAQGRASDETTLALHERPALPSWGIFFFFLSPFFFICDHRRDPKWWQVGHRCSPAPFL